MGRRVARALGAGRTWAAVAFLLAVVSAAVPSVSCGQGGSPRAPPAPLGNIDDQLMHTPDGGIPILLAVPYGASAIGILYDPTLKDPMTDWGGCMEQFRRCFYTAAKPGRIGGCVGDIKKCSTTDPNQGGSDCCPSACIDAFNGAVAGGKTDNDAVNSTIVQGDCVKDFTSFTEVTP